MAERRSHPAVFAGLLGSAAWASTPTIALASPVDDVLEVVSTSLLLQFVCGCAIGAAVAGIVTFVIDHINGVDEDEIINIPSGKGDDTDDFWKSLDLEQAQKKAKVDETTGNLGRFRTGKITIDLPAIADKAVASAVTGPRHYAPAADKRPVRTSSRRGGHFAPAAEKQRGRSRRVIGMATQASRQGTNASKHSAAAVAKAKAESKAAARQAAPVTKAAGRHFAGGATVANQPMGNREALRKKASTQKSAPATAGVPAHRVPEVIAPLPSVPRTPSYRNATQRPNPASSARARARARRRLATLPVIDAQERFAVDIDAAIEPMREPDVRPVAPEFDTMDLARPETDTGFFRRITETPIAEDRLDGAASHAAGAHSAPKETPVEDEQRPSITGRLMRQVGDRAKSVRTVLAERIGYDDFDDVPIITRADGTHTDIGGRSWFEQTLAPALASISGHLTLDDTAPREVNKAVEKREVPESSSRASYIAQHVAEVNNGVFPELRSAEELAHDDAWEQALAAMNENIVSETPEAFHDMIGGPATIDDPDGLEPPTGFIPFRVPAAHPEVVDTTTYVDYLLRDEISHNGSRVLKNMPHAHLRVIEGGSGRIGTKGNTDATGPVAPASRGRHFAPASYVAEAL